MKSHLEQDDMSIFKKYRYSIRAGMAIFTAILLLNGCTGATIYHFYQPIDKSGWGKHDTLVYQLPKDSIPDVYTISIGLRTTDTYLYTSLWIVMEEDLKAKGVFVRDTINYPVTDKSGSMLGSGFSSHQQEIKVKTIAVTPQSGTTVKLFHIMKRESIQGIQNIGINVSSDSLQRQFSKR